MKSSTKVIVGSTVVGLILGGVAFVAIGLLSLWVFMEMMGGLMGSNSDFGSSSGLSIPPQECGRLRSGDKVLAKVQGQYCSLANADLSGADLTGANLTGTRWSLTTCPDGTDSVDNGTPPESCIGHGGGT